MRDRHPRIAPVALVLLAAVATTSCASSGSTAPVSGEKEPLVASEVVVQVKPDGLGGAVVIPDTAIVRAGQKLVIATCCEELKITWKKRESRVPEPICKGNECKLVGPVVKEPVTVDYFVDGKCGEKPFKRDPRLIFTK